VVDEVVVMAEQVFGAEDLSPPQRRGWRCYIIITSWLIAAGNDDVAHDSRCW